MNTALPPACATPRPSRSSDSTAATPCRSGAGPGIQEFAPMRALGPLERASCQLAFGAVTVAVEGPAQALHAQVHEVRVGSVGLAVGADALDAAVKPRVPHFRAVHAELARQAAELRHLVEGRIRARLE